MADDNNDGIQRALQSIVDMGWGDIGGTCPNCGHGPKFQRHVGAPLFGHTQTSCGCRLARGLPNVFGVTCGCEWTEDS